MSDNPATTPLTLTVGERTLEYYDARTADTQHVVFYHHGTPNLGEPPVPLLEASAHRGLGWVSLSRPGYGESTRWPGRSVGDIAGDVAQIADALGIERFAVLGHSGGGPHALACAALLPDRVAAAVSMAGLVPLTAPGQTWSTEDWLAGMYPGGEQELRAAMAGPEARAKALETAEFDPSMFTPEDFAALEGDWAWMDHVVDAAMGVPGMIDDDVAYVQPWGVDLAHVTAPTLLIHGQRDRLVPSSHSKWLSEQIPHAELWLEPHHSHVSLLARAVDALDWLVMKTS